MAVNLPTCLEPTHGPVRESMDGGVRHREQPSSADRRDSVEKALAREITHLVLSGMSILMFKI